MRKSIVIGLAVSALFCSGCLAMMVPGLAYSGYQYAHKKNDATTASSSTESKPTTSATRQKIPDSDIE